MACLGLCFVAAVMALMSAFWQHLSSSASSTMVHSLTYGAVTGHVGAGAMAIGWVATTLCLASFIGLLVFVMSISVLTAIG